MIAAVLDANVFCSGMAGYTNGDSLPGAVLRAWTDGHFTLITSTPLIEEIRRSVRKPYFTSRVSAQRSARLLALLRYRSTIIPISVTVTAVATHPEDDLVLAAAVSAKANYLVTGDEKLRSLGSYHEVAIVSPRRFLDLLAAS